MWTKVTKKNEKLITLIAFSLFFGIFYYLCIVNKQKKEILLWKRR